MPSHSASATSIGMRPVTEHRSGRNSAPRSLSASITSADAPRVGRSGRRRPGSPPAAKPDPRDGTDRSVWRGKAWLPAAGPGRAVATAEPPLGALPRRLSAPSARNPPRPDYTARREGGAGRRPRVRAGLPTPRLHSGFDALELFDHLTKAPGTDKAVARSDVLPGHEETHELLPRTSRSSDENGPRMAAWMRISRWRADIALQGRPRRGTRAPNPRRRVGRWRYGPQRLGWFRSPSEERARLP